MKDLFGKAILDYQTNSSPENIITSTSISEDDEMEVAYLFRSFDEMPAIEQKALQLANGKTLDIGCGAGSHSLYLQNERNINVHSIDISKNAIQACLLRGLKNIRAIDVLDLENEKYDTILLLMNGTGIFETLEKSTIYLQKLKSLLNPNGQLLVDTNYDGIFEIVNDPEIKSMFQPNSDFQRQLGRILVAADAAHSFGATYSGKRSGAIADVSCFSFHAVKNLTTAEGGTMSINFS